jgi:hypothetical protein
VRASKVTATRGNFGSVDKLTSTVAYGATRGENGGGEGEMVLQCCIAGQFSPNVVIDKQSTYLFSIFIAYLIAPTLHDLNCR